MYDGGLRREKWEIEVEEILNHEHAPARLDLRQLHEVHKRLVNVFQQAIDWMERQWPTPRL